MAVKGHRILFGGHRYKNSTDVNKTDPFKFLYEFLFAREGAAGGGTVPWLVLGRARDTVLLLECDSGPQGRATGFLLNITVPLIDSISAH